MPRVYIGVGSNIEPEINIPKALRMLSEVMPIAAVSTFYRTPELGQIGADASGGILARSIGAEFINGMVAIEADLPPRELKFDVLRGIETALGRVRGPDKCEPRTIDLDIAVYGDLVVCEDDLVIPDPDITSRAFLAAPLLELDPAMVLPGSGERLAGAVSRMPMDDMTPLECFTRQLRQEMRLEP